MKKVILVLISIALISLASAETVHRVEADEQRINVNSTIGLECGDRCPVNNWQFSYTLPEDSKIISIQDSIGEIDTYTLRGQNLRLETNEGSPRRKERLQINYVIQRHSNEEGGLQMREIAFAGFTEETTSGSIKADDLISGRTTHGFEASFGSREFNFTGEGPVQVNFNFGDGFRQKYYEFFSTPGGKNQVNNSEISYEIALALVGRQNSFDRIPVLIYGEGYDTENFEWSAGAYRASTVRVKNSDEMRPVLSHETVHSLNNPLLNWDRTSSAWFDEGVARHAESLMRKQLYRTGQSDRRPANLFGEEISYTDFDKGLDYTVSSKGDREQLWRYYQQNKSFMKDWAPRKGNRDFGYAYSELIIKNYLYRGGNLNQLYSQIDQSETIESNEEKWRIYSRHMDLTPCKTSSRQAFNQCLDNINEYDFDVKRASPSGDTRSTIDIREVELPEREHTWEDDLNLLFQKLEELVQQILRIWRS